MSRTTQTVRVRTIHKIPLNKLSLLPTNLSLKPFLNFHVGHGHAKYADNLGIFNECIYLSAERICVHHRFQACSGSRFTLRLVRFRNCFSDPHDIYSVINITCNVLILSLDHQPTIHYWWILQSNCQTRHKGRSRNVRIQL